MSRDPFEHMRDRNPVPSEDEPMAPAALAERIMGGRARTARRPMPGWAIATASAAAVLAVGGVMMILTGPRTPVVGSGDTTTTAADISTTSTPPAPAIVEASVYFFADLDDDWIHAGPFLISVAAPIEARDGGGGEAQLVHQALTVLFDGPLVDGFSTAVPEGTTVLDVSVDADGVALIDLSGDFVTGGGSFSMLGRLAQVIYTATAVDGVEAVRLSVEGTATTVFGGEGVMIDDPATREGFDDLLPPVFLDSPAYGATTGNPLVAFGKANTFEATLLLKLTLLDGTVLWEGFTTATCGTGCWGDWQVEIPYELDTAQLGILYAYTDSMEDGSAITIRSHRVMLTPGDGTPVADCSGVEATTPLEDQDGLPAAAAETRAAIWAAAVSCDWEALADLVSANFAYSFAVEGDPAGYWAEIEADDHDPMLYLAELLTRPYGTVDVDGATHYVWPSASAIGWENTTAADRDALRPLYDDDAFDLYEEFGGYIGYRIGITDDGTWIFFIGGD